MIPPAGPVAYLTGEYPRATDTFILREVAALRRLGFDIRTCSIRTTGTEHLVGAEQRTAHAETFRVLRAAANPLTALRAHAGLIERSPRRWLSALGLARRSLAPGLKALIWQAFYLIEAGVLAAHLRRIGAVHLHNHFGDSSCTVAMLAARMAGIPFSFTMHGPAIFFEPIRWRIDMKIAEAAFVACISHFCRSQAMVFSDPAYWSKLRIVHCGIEPARYADAPPPPGAKRLLFVGRLAAVKGVPVLLEALAGLAERHPDARLVLVGDGPERIAIEAEAARLGLTGRVEFVGYRSQVAVAAALAESDVLVLPSFAEGLPVVLMEALASSRPVVATRIAGVSELVEHGVNGLLVPPGDPDSLAAALDRLLSDPEAALRMGAAGVAHVAAEHDSETEATRLAALITGAAGPGIRPQSP